MVIFCSRPSQGPARHLKDEYTEFLHRIQSNQWWLKDALQMAPAADGFLYYAPGAVMHVDMRGVATLLDEPRLAEARFQT